MESGLASRYGRAVSLHEQGRIGDAERAYNEILSAYPDQAETLHMFGVLLLQTERFDDGVTSIRRAISVQPDFVDAHFNCGVALMMAQRWQEAEESFAAASRLAPAYGDAHYNLGVVRLERGRYMQALAAFDLALGVQPDHADALRNRGIALSHLGRTSEALAAFEKLLALSPQDAGAHLLHSSALKAQGRLEEALDALTSAISLEPENFDALVNRGTILRLLGSPDEALASYGAALAIRLDGAQAWAGRAAALMDLLRLDEAAANFDEALRLDPANARERFNKSLLFLLTGKFDAGWAAYEARKALHPDARAYTLGPAWDGRAPLLNKTLFVTWEQGFGDTIQFSRYASVAANAGARVVLSVQNALVPLLTGFDPRVAVIGEDEAPPEFDLHAALLSLPGAFATTEATIPPMAPLCAAPAKAAVWAQRVGRRSKPRIGLAWAGHASHLNDRSRSIPFARLAPLIAADVEWISLQKEVRPSDLDALSRSRQLRDFRSDLHDFADTAGLISHLDAVVTVDTAIAHLAAAMGKPTFILLPFSPDWRWLLDCDDSPWYPQARLFRQTAPGDWARALECARAAVEALPERLPISA